MTDTLFRTFTPDIAIRSAGDGRTLHGIAVPYGVEQRIDDALVEVFARGAFNAQVRAANRVPLAREHMALGGRLIGRLTMLRDDAAGLYFEARVSKTELGDETLALLEDEALREVSIGFRERQNRRRRNGAIERVTADLRELAVVMEGAYGQHAAVAGVRAKQDEMGPGATACTCGATDARLAQARQILAGLPVLPPVA